MNGKAKSEASLNFTELRPGKSVEGQTIPSYKTEATKGDHLYLMAGTHGDEVEGVYVVQQLFTWLKEQDISLPLIVLPILNVDGHRVQSRVNSNGVDLNRNYPSKDWTKEARAAKYNPGTHPLSEPENVYLDKLFKKYPPRLIISVHSWKPLINYNGDCKDVAEFLHQHNNYPICDDIEGHPTPGSLGEYGPQEYNCPVLTFECPLLSEREGLKQIWEENEAGFKNLFAQSTILNRFLRS